MKKTIVFFLFIFFGFCQISAQELGNDYNVQLQKLITSYRLISALYVDDVDYNKVVESSIVAMLKDLDPHSAYISPEDVARMNEPLKGNFDGVGIQFNVLNDSLIVVQAIPGGPSEKVGIRAGDRFVKVDTTIIAGVKCSRKKMMELLRGEKGTEVVVWVKRKGVSELIPFNITRDKIPIYSLVADYMVNNEVGYIKLNRFASTSHKEFMAALTRLKKQGMKDLILDLQDNGGGYMQPAIQIADEFLAKNERIVYTEGRKSPKRTFDAEKGGAFNSGALVVLVDESSASASEILTGAIQDWDRGLVVGRRTFGKGLVQKPLNLPDGAMMRLTIARYHTPSGRCIQKPYEEGNKSFYNKELQRRFENGEMVNPEHVDFPDSLRYKTLKKGRDVFGGGGIYPDVFVPIDTTTYSKFHRKVIAQGLLNTFILTYIDNNRDSMMCEYPDFEKFNASYVVDSSFFNHLVTVAAEDSIIYDESKFKVSHDLLFLQMKALVASNLYDNSDYFQVMNTYNAVFNKGIEVLERKKSYFDVLK